MTDSVRLDSFNRDMFLGNCPCY